MWRGGGRLTWLSLCVPFANEFANVLINKSPSPGEPRTRYFGGLAHEMRPVEYGLLLLESGARGVPS